jgi:AcrR family transcriptional regulator
VTTSDHIPKRRGRPSSGGREAILDAALALMRDEGVSKLTSREVAARAGVSDASVYYHFGDRRGLLIAAYERGMKPLPYIEGLPVDTGWRDVLGRAFMTLETFFDDLLPVLTAAGADAELGQLTSSYILDNDLGPHKGVAYLGAYLRSEQAAGRVDPDADIDAVALLVINAAFSRSARRRMLRPDELDERMPSVERQLAVIGRLLELPA